MSSIQPIPSLLLKKLLNQEDFIILNEELRNRSGKSITEACL